MLKQATPFEIHPPTVEDLVVNLLQGECEFFIDEFTKPYPGYTTYEVTIGVAKSAFSFENHTPSVGKNKAKKKTGLSKRVCIFKTELLSTLTQNTLVNPLRYFNDLPINPVKIYFLATRSLNQKNTLRTTKVLFML